MSEMKTPASFIAAASFGMFIGTFVLTAATRSAVVFIVGMAMTMGLTRAMIGVGQQ